MGRIRLTESFDEWWDNATDLEQVNWLFSENYSRIVDPDDVLAGTKLNKVTEFKRKGRKLRVTSEDGGVAYFRNYYFEPVKAVSKAKEWFLTNERFNESNNANLRLLAGRLVNGKYILLSPVKSDPQVVEAFE